MRTPAVFFTPIPPMETGLATYAIRVLEGTESEVEWTVAYPEGGDPDSLPEPVRAFPISSIEDTDGLPDVRIFNIGNSLDCFPVVTALYRFGGTSILHETVLHHVLRYGWEGLGRPDEYFRELSFCHGPSAERVRRLLDRPTDSEAEYDALLKSFPLTGRVLHRSNAVAVLNEYSLSRVGGAFQPDYSMLIGHPLSELPELDERTPPWSYTVLMAGGNHPGRNLGQLLRAMESFREEMPDAGLLLLGGGYPDGLPDWVRALGRLPEKEYQEWIRTANTAVDFRHPTCGETSGSLLEVMRAGVPCITSDSGAYAYLPSDGVLRVPVESGAVGLAAALSYISNLPDKGMHIGAKGAEHALSTGSSARLSADWTALIRMAVSSGTPRLKWYDTMAWSNTPWSLSAAWHDVPAGFRRDLATTAVSWGFEGRAVIAGPPDAEAARLTAWGDGTVNGMDLPVDPETVEVSGCRLEFHGEGWLTGVRWLPARSGEGGRNE